jgi:hypothetical protein
MLLLLTPAIRGQMREVVRVCTTEAFSKIALLMLDSEVPHVGCQFVANHACGELTLGYSPERPEQEANYQLLFYR